MRTHYSSHSEPIMLHKYTQLSPSELPGMVNNLMVGRKWKGRPVGLWYAFGESDWITHVAAEYSNLPIGQDFQGSAHTIAPNNAKLFIIDSVEKLYELNKLYPEVGSDDWRGLASDYDGIELTCKASLEALVSEDSCIQDHYDWISKLEINSGCIWDLEKVTIQKLPDLDI